MECKYVMLKIFKGRIIKLNHVHSVENEAITGLSTSKSYKVIFKKNTCGIMENRRSAQKCRRRREATNKKPII